MAVKEILDKRVIDLDMTAKTKDEVIRHLAGLLMEAGYIPVSYTHLGELFSVQLHPGFLAGKRGKCQRLSLIHI